MERKTFFADVLLPLPLPGYFTYRIPFDLNDSVKSGQRVVVQFGKKKIYTALVRRIHEKVPEKYQPKYVLSILDPLPVVHEQQFLFWEWISEYYMCTPGEVMNAALPSGLKLASETRIALRPDYSYNPDLLSEKEILITEALMNSKKLSVQEVSQISDLQKVIPLIKTLIEKGVVVTEEELVDRYSPKMETFVRLAQEYKDDEIKLREVFDQLSKRAFKQLQLLMSYINLSMNMQEMPVEVSKGSLLKTVDGAVSAFNALVKKGVFETYKKEKSRFGEHTAHSNAGEIVLSDHQSAALESIRDQFDEKEVVLLHGITSSGKTELYVKMIDEVLKQGRQVLYLLPEIALTSQIISRLYRFFGDEIGIYHSRYNENERVETWNRVLANDTSKLKKCTLVLGARSAMFLPYSDLGLVIVDEEHDTSYKQFDPAPRYNARDSAIFLANLFGAKTLLGSATPSVESFHNASRGKYGLALLTERYGNVKVPEIIVTDIRKESLQKKMYSHFSSRLYEDMTKAFELKEQVILFQNRRGFSLRLECDECSWIPMCIHCDISLTYHKSSNKLICHYCGYTTSIPAQCPECESPRLSMKGFGTEKVEEEIQLLFPDAIVKRMDYDTTRTKFAHHRIIQDFEDRKIDVLVGTQMVTKGLDFDNVSLVGILNADNLINFPDFRSYERSFQLMQQVSGRAGRKKKQGKVIIQSYKPDHPVIEFVLNNDFQGMYENQIRDRIQYRYPPFYRLILIKVLHREPAKVNKAATVLAKELRAHLGARVLGPEYPLVSRIRNQYIKHILIKLEKGSKLSAVKQLIKDASLEIYKLKDTKSVRIIFDVDPQ